MGWAWNLTYGMARHTAARWVLIALKLLAVTSWARDFVGPHAKAFELVRAKGRGDGGVGGVAPAGDQDAAGARNVVAWIEGVPSSPEISFEPPREVHRRVRRKHAEDTR